MLAETLDQNVTALLYLGRAGGSLLNPAQYRHFLTSLEPYSSRRALIVLPQASEKAD
jgi:hypothetical protein